MANRDTLIQSMQLPEATVRQINDRGVALADLDTMSQAIHDVYCGIMANHEHPSDKDRDQAAQLLARRWLITDSAGEEHEVEGEGVVGEQPTLYPGRVHEYRSFCVLKSPRGAMEGDYRFARPDGSRFEAAIPRFALDAAADG